MKLYNTLTKHIEEIKPKHPPKITIYTCGPTVYDYPHIGNWFTFIRYDLLIRTLKLSGLQPEWVLNITDVGHLISDADEGEDKLEKGARREGKTAWGIANFYTSYFVDALRRLNITPPYYLPKATDHIPEQIELVKTLEDKGYTYKTDDGIYFDTAKFPTYGHFAQLDLDEQQAGKRVDFNAQKRNISDFALWKFSPTDAKRDMEWQSPWGVGFPGWHVECSAMSMKYLGKTLDIHAGGIDHLPVHHTNEIAQSEAATGKPYARHWMHTNHIMIDGEKIAKSSGNGITLEDIEAKGYSLAAFRLHVLESHYRSQSRFSWESLEAAQNRLRDYQAMADMRFQIKPASSDEGTSFDDFEDLILDDLLNDLNTPEALACLSQIAANTKEVIYKTNEQQFLHFLAFIDAVLGIQLTTSNDITDSQKVLIAKREKARADKDWAASDSLRDSLKADGIGLRDTPHGALWFRL